MIIKKHLKQTIVTYFCCSLLFACSADKDVNDSYNSVSNNTYSTRGFVIEQPQQITVYVPPPESDLNKEQLFSGALEAHNSVRAKQGLQPLKWSEELTKYSQEWSDQLGNGESCKMYHRPEKSTYGENLFTASPKIWTAKQKEIYRERDKVTIRDVVKKWADEEQWYDYKTNSCQPGQQCGHYTQLVSSDTTEVGCAVNFCPDESQTWVCSYNPPGNSVGRRPY